MTGKSMTLCTVFYAFYSAENTPTKQKSNSLTRRSLRIISDSEESQETQQSKRPRKKLNRFKPKQHITDRQTCDIISDSDTEVGNHTPIESLNPDPDVVDAEMDEVRG